MSINTLNEFYKKILKKELSKLKIPFSNDQLSLLDEVFKSATVVKWKTLEKKMKDLENRAKNLKESNRTLQDAISLKKKEKDNTRKKLLIFEGSSSQRYSLKKTWKDAIKEEKGGRKKLKKEKEKLKPIEDDITKLKNEFESIKDDHNVLKAYLYRLNCSIQLIRITKTFKPELEFIKKTSIVGQNNAYSMLEGPLWAIPTILGKYENQRFHSGSVKGIKIKNITKDIRLEHVIDKKAIKEYLVHDLENVKQNIFNILSLMFGCVISAEEETKLGVISFEDLLEIINTKDVFKKYREIGCRDVKFEEKWKVMVYDRECGVFLHDKTHPYNPYSEDNTKIKKHNDFIQSIFGFDTSFHKDIDKWLRQLPKIDGQFNT
jgi:hypothetical protein